MFQQLNICFTFVYRLKVPMILRYNEPIIIKRANSSLRCACPLSNARLVSPINNKLAPGADTEILEGRCRT